MSIVLILLCFRILIVPDSDYIVQVIFLDFRPNASSKMSSKMDMYLKGIMNCLNVKFWVVLSAQ